MLYVAGVDEAGRGPLAGPVVASAVVLPPKPVIYGIKDSKKLTPKAREKLFRAILENCVSLGVGVVSESLIDVLNIRNASLLAMKIAVSQLRVEPYIVFVDGRDEIPGLEFPQRCVVKGDSTIYVISAASVVAKVIRDRIMCEMDTIYPCYGFAKHKGYPTQMHVNAIKRYGFSPIHRRSFVSKRLVDNESDF